MIKKLDKLILKSFIGPFIATFFIAFFVLMMQSVWKYIDDLVGKGLDFVTIGKFIWYVSATLITLTMPIAILISSIMTFGNLGESFELVAIKSSGISLLRFMRPLIWVAILLCGITFMFANYIIPYANLKFAALYRDIRFKNPAFDLKPNVFFTYIPNYAIKIGEKKPDGKTIKNVLIYEQNNPLQDNAIIADSGVMQISPDKKFLEFTLFSGFRYTEQGNTYDTTNEYIRLGFSSFKKLIDMSSLAMTNTNDSAYRNNSKMLSAHQISHIVDSLKKTIDSFQTKLQKDISIQIPYLSVNDSVWNSIRGNSTKLISSEKLIPDSIQLGVIDGSIGIVNNLKNTFQFSSSEIENKVSAIKEQKIEWQRKYSLSFACLILFFIGAPLGSIIRKGGLGMPLVMAVVFFLIFHLLNMFGEKFAKEGITSPFLGMWFSIFILAPVGAFLTYKAMYDSQLFKREAYYRLFKKIRNMFQKNN